MFKFTEHNGVVAPLNISNIDTDAIIPKQFLQKVNKIGFGKYLFHDWRFIDKNQLKINPNFILNNYVYKNASILLTRGNFGCGSSREHAVWSLLDYGFKVIISSSFSDIFFNNSFNNKLLLVVLEKKHIDYLFNLVDTKIGISFNVSLINKKITAGDLDIPFQIDDFQRLCLLNNWDNIDLTMKINHKIKSYEDNISSFLLERQEFTS
ncbi:3-isopropylmalate dehydratase small subunit (plasmid) [Buchnera aphidicola (Rhopalosiphum padi)]|uniref:3-isopropylmalate dehydratase small subunit n=1 Tax=Buchnera aphidicola subsp. Rhopalosiphum padi TaxID=98793 RepID=A0A4D6YHZ4_BUCRP|nr:3-isopropylmalate dehydratase small subunit [Buchnera aphidicola]QCI25238.1 3-isopropylmalate dehydratase small subunit [Buchnera aphidicola (Rhopalosiphum padi)]